MQCRIVDDETEIQYQENLVCEYIFLVQVPTPGRAGFSGLAGRAGTRQPGPPKCKLRALRLFFCWRCRFVLFAVMNQSCHPTYHECCTVQGLCVYRSCLYDCIVHKVVEFCGEQICPTDYYGTPCVPKCALSHIRTTRVWFTKFEDLLARPYACDAPDARTLRLFERPIVRRKSHSDDAN